jgi:arylsulfatase A-like enzyme
MAALDRNGVAADTLIFVSSDNGPEVNALKLRVSNVSHLRSDLFQRLCQGEKPPTEDEPPGNRRHPSWRALENKKQQTEPEFSNSNPLLFVRVLRIPHNPPKLVATHVPVPPHPRVVVAIKHHPRGKRT